MPKQDIKNTNKKRPLFRTGFTILELLVVIAIISMVLAFVMVQIRYARERGRDARREEDIKQMLNALAIYDVSNHRYPVCPDEVIINGTTDCFSATLSGEGFASVAPRDPLNRGSTCGGGDSFIYCYQSNANGTTYTFRYRLETNSIKGKLAGWQTFTE